MTTSEWVAWPGNRIWSWQVTRVIGLADFGASNFAEVYEAVQRIVPNDHASWRAEWLGLGERVEALAEQAVAGGVVNEAANSYFRACQYTAWRSSSRPATSRKSYRSCTA